MADFLFMSNRRLSGLVVLTCAMSYKIDNIVRYIETCKWIITFSTFTLMPALPWSTKHLILLKLDYY